MESWNRERKLIPEGVSKTIKIRAKNVSKYVFWDFGALLGEPTFRKLLIRNESGLQIWKNRKFESRRLFAFYFLDWPGRVCGSGWGFGACKFVDVCSARFVPGGGGGFIEDAMRRDTAAPSNLGLGGLWIVVPCWHSFGWSWQILADLGRFRQISSEPSLCAVSLRINICKILFKTGPQNNAKSINKSDQVAKHRPQANHKSSKNHQKSNRNRFGKMVGSRNAKNDERRVCARSFLALRARFGAPFVGELGPKEGP